MEAISIKKLAPEDSKAFAALIQLFQVAFEHEEKPEPDLHYLQALLQDARFWVFVAIKTAPGEEPLVVGGLTAYMLYEYYEAKPLIYLYDLAVKEAFQRRGIGQKLVSALKAHSQGYGAVQLFVQADLEDEHALEFYRASGATATSVVHFNYELAQALSQNNDSSSNI